LDYFKVIRKYFSKIKDNENRYKANKFSVLGYLLSILLLTICFSSKLGNLTVAFESRDGIAFASKLSPFAGWLAIMFGDFTTR
jgi:hypothetical protein